MQETRRNALWIFLISFFISLPNNPTESQEAKGDRVSESSQGLRKVSKRFLLMPLGRPRGFCRISKGQGTLPICSKLKGRARLQNGDIPPHAFCRHQASCDNARRRGNLIFRSLNSSGDLHTCLHILWRFRGLIAFIGLYHGPGARGRS